MTYRFYLILMIEKIEKPGNLCVGWRRNSLCKCQRIIDTRLCKKVRDSKTLKRETGILLSRLGRAALSRMI